MSVCQRLGLVLLVTTVIGAAWRVRAQDDQKIDNPWRLFNVSTGDLRSNLVLTLTETTDGAVWVGGPSGVHQLRNEQWSAHNKETGALPANEVLFTKATKDGSLWVATTGGLSRFAAEQWVTYNRENGELPENRVYGLVEGVDGITWAVTATAITGFRSGKRFSVELSPVASPSNRQAVADVDGAVWVGQPDSGVARVRWQHSDRYSREVTNLPPSNVTALALLHEKELWTGTELGHLARFMDEKWSAFESVGQHFDGSPVTRIDACGSAAVCISSEAGRVVLFQDAQLKPYARFSMLPRKHLSALITSSPAQMWLSRQIRDLCPEASQPSPAAVDARIRVTVKSREDTLWLGASDGTAWQVRGDRCDSTSLGGRSVSSMLPSRDGSVWVGTESGVFRLNGGQRFQIDDSVVRNVDAQRMLEGRDGRVWIGTFDHGIARFTPPVASLQVPSHVTGNLLPATLAVRGGKAADANWLLHYRVSDDPAALPSTYSRTPFNNAGVAHMELAADTAGAVHVDAFATDSNGTIVKLSDGVMRVTRGSDRTFWWTFARAGIAMQVAMWAIVFVVYPYSPSAQALFLWNSQFRRVAGLWYIDMLIVAVPWLGRRILRPFRDQLLSELQPELLHEYYTQTMLVAVRPDGSRASAGPLPDVLGPRKGHVLLQGPSGSGKTHSVRYAVSERSQIAAYVPARLCAGGVVEAIVELLPGHLNDQQLIEKLIFSGTLPVYIDGLNEVNADVRGLIVGFLQRYARGHIIVLTQPLAWASPKHMTTYELQALSPSQAIDYVAVKMPRNPQLVDRCKEFVAAATSDALPKEVREQTREVLSVPFDLDLLIELVEAGHEPQLLAIQHQFVSLVMDEYRQRALRSFPVDTIATLAYQARLAGTREVAAEALDAELLQVMRERRVLTMRTDTAQRFFFRHDRLQDYFITHYFLEHNAAIDRHVSDVRFLGPYLLLAERLPDVEAIALAARLTLAAAQSRDHSVADPFVLKLDRVRRARVESVSVGSLDAGV